MKRKLTSILAADIVGFSRLVEAAEEATLTRQKELRLSGYAVLHATGKKAAAQVLERCDNGQIVIVNVRLSSGSDCNVYDLNRLRRTGALAITAGKQGLQVVSSRDVTGRRLWSP